MNISLPLVDTINIEHIEHIIHDFDVSWRRYLNDETYIGGFVQSELNQLFDAMQSNFRAWVTGFCPLAVGTDLQSIAVQEFTRTFFNMRPDIALSVSKTCFQSDLRSLLPQVRISRELPITFGIEP